MEDVTEWQDRLLGQIYPQVFFDALRVKVRDEDAVKNNAVYLALDVQADGIKEILRISIEQTESTKVWLRVMTELKNRGLEGRLIIGGRRPERLSTSHQRGLPAGENLAYIMYLIRNSLDFAGPKDCKLD